MSSEVRTPAEEQAIEKLADALHWRGEGRKITWEQELAEHTENHYGVVPFYREWAGEILDVLRSESFSVPCPECAGTDAVCEHGPPGDSCDDCEWEPCSACDGGRVRSGGLLQALVADDQRWGTLCEDAECEWAMGAPVHYHALRSSGEVT